MSKFKVGDTATIETHGYSWWTDGKEYDVLLSCGSVGIFADDGDFYPIHEVERRLTMAVPAPADPIHQPHHYARYVIEPITFINANKLPFNIGNVIKYALRYDAKNGVEDLRKAIRYLEMQIEVLAREERVAEGHDPAEVWSAKL